MPAGALLRPLPASLFTVPECYEGQGTEGDMVFQPPHFLPTISSNPSLELGLGERREDGLGVRIERVPLKELKLQVSNLHCFFEWPLIILIHGIF